MLHMLPNEMRLLFASPFYLSDETLLTNVVCGILSGVISSTIANPTDVLKVAVSTPEAGFCRVFSGQFCSLLRCGADKAGSGSYVELLYIIWPQKGLQARSNEVLAEGA